MNRLQTIRVMLVDDHNVVRSGLATVKAHISNILSKLQVSSRAEAIAFAIKHRTVSL